MGVQVACVRAVPATTTIANSAGIAVKTNLLHIMYPPARQVTLGCFARKFFVGGTDDGSKVLPVRNDELRLELGF